MEIKSFYHQATHSLTYLLWDRQGVGILIDPVADLDSVNWKLSYESASEIASFIESHKIQLEWILESHVHADHISASNFFRKQFSSKVAISSKVVDVQRLLVPVLDLQSAISCDGSQFDRLIGDGESFLVGEMSFDSIACPGHTPACQAYLCNGKLFVGDILFLPDFGTGRCDFPGGSSEQLYHSIYQKLYSLPEETEFYVGHDYQPGGRELQMSATIGQSKSSNIHLNAQTSEDEFVKFRTERDRTLSLPKLIYPSLNYNLNGGVAPVVINDRSMITIPITEN